MVYGTVTSLDCCIVVLRFFMRANCDETKAPCQTGKKISQGKVCLFVCKSDEKLQGIMAENQRFGSSDIIIRSNYYSRMFGIAILTEHELD